VINKVSKTQASGYLSIPKTGSAAPGNAASSGK